MIHPAHFLGHNLTASPYNFLNIQPQVKLGRFISQCACVSLGHHRSVANARLAKDK